MQNMLNKYSYFTVRSHYWMLLTISNIRLLSIHPSAVIFSQPFVLVAKPTATEAKLMELIVIPGTAVLNSHWAAAQIGRDNVPNRLRCCVDQHPGHLSGTYLFRHQDRPRPERDRLEWVTRHFRQSLLSSTFDLTEEGPWLRCLIGTVTADEDEWKGPFGGTQLLEGSCSCKSVVVGDPAISFESS
jgi:hypothetical protein